ncbi:MAG: 2-dehydro-3-deoxygalactonokinase [Bacteroidota bacterium]|nr:2-dehydro-3-deoxygalactonokinase [Bacteroidota bacterium]
MGTFISCDWGTSTFRLRLIDAEKKEIISELISEEGISETYQQWKASDRPEAERIHFYQNILNGSISKLGGAVDIATPVILSGMASSSIGLTELPYRKFPFTWNPSEFLIEKTEGDKNFSHPLLIVSGFKTETDVMRGEETLLLGCDVTGDEERVYIFPGTHSKHVFVKNRRGVDFKTYMTGEVFNLLAEKSLLRNAVMKGNNEKSFMEGFKEGMDNNILHVAFMVRTRHLLQNTDTISNYQFLSGLLIGTELRELKENNCPVYIVCTENLKQAYMSGLKLNGKREIHYLNADEMLVRGHCKIADEYL